MSHDRRFPVAALAAGLVLAAALQAAPAPRPAAPAPLYPAYPSETPAQFDVRSAAFDYERREAMVPMRDGTRLRTFILVPRGAKGAPMLLTRTPYDAADRGKGDHPRLAMVVPQMDDTAAAAGYILVFQDVRGKHGSEGDYVMTRPLRGPLNPTPVDHATDAYDTIDWLVKHVPESNGRVGMIGGSYEGYTTVMGAVHAHPALKVVVPFAPMVDGWMGDDWFHNGAFRQDGTLQYIYEQQATRGSELKWWPEGRDTYAEFLRLGSAGAAAASRGLDQLGFWRQLVEHTAYDAFWQEQAVDKLLARDPPRVPMLIVSGLFDQEDIYGGPALYRALAPHDPQGRLYHLVLGPWNHGQGRREGRGIGPVLFAGDTAGWFRRTVMQPFLDHFLKDGPEPDVPRVLAYETGADAWHRYDDWPVSCAHGCAAASRPLYLLPGGRLGFARPDGTGEAYDEYVSDPAHPVPYRPRPTLDGNDPQSTWGDWLADDQRHASARPDVATWVSEPLVAPLRVAGQPRARLWASTTGTDADWVVKLIDVYPDDDAYHADLSGYEFMVAADILRGRFRADPSRAQPIAAGEVLDYDIRLPNASHTFLPGHRIMVQVQSSWFPLYDRNPQRFVPNIMLAAPGDYQKATQRIWHDAAHASAIELPVVASP